MIEVTKTYRTSDDLLKEIREHYPDELIEIRCMGRGDLYDEEYLLFLNGTKTRLHFSPHTLSPAELEVKTFGYAAYDELLAMLTYEIRRVITQRMIERRKEIQILYEDGV